MAHPNFDNLHLQLSRKIGDAVAVSTDNGIVTSLQRSDYLNAANRFIRNYFRKDIVKAQQFLQGLCTLVNHTFAADGVAVPTGFDYAVDLRTPAKRLIQVLPEKKFVLEFDTNKNLQSHFLVSGNKIYAYLSGDEITAGTGKLLYIKVDTGSALADPDIAIDSMWYDALVDIAASYFSADKGELDFEAATLQRVKLILGVIA